MRNRYSSAPDPEWQRQTALRRFERIRQQYKDAGRPASDAQIAHLVAGYVGETTDQVLRWVRGGK
jgi:alkanesulfonate monooxygenase SsuD/methylene tetrahydromethanopterin reductase-like flavin-dependent oxidoreductase (luciferase family)